MIPPKAIRLLKSSGWLRDIDIQFGDYAKRKSEENELVSLFAMVISRHCSDGNVCLNLSKLDEIFISETQLLSEVIGRFDKLELMDGGFCGLPGMYVPLILDGELLYMHKHFEREKRVAMYINNNAQILSVDHDLLKDLLSKMYGENGEPDYQKLACALACLKKFCVISGGPGTGKTTTVSNIIKISSHLSDKKINVVMTAPSGKAVGRLKESISSSDFFADVCLEFYTVHRLLGYSKYGFKKNLDLSKIDIIIVDESSMIDLMLLDKLMNSISGNTRLILLGDKNQLSSVDVGASFGEICSVKTGNSYSDELSRVLSNICGFNILRNNNSGAGDSIIFLEKTYRFTGSLKDFSQAVITGDYDRALNCVNNSEVKMDNPETLSKFKKMIEDDVLKYFGEISRADNAEEALILMEKFRILCAANVGQRGSDSVNKLVIDILDKHGVADKKERFYHGKLIMIRVNDYRYELFNGDAGVIMKESDKFFCYFRNYDGSIKKIPVSMLPLYETFYACTVHKSQGSEFDHVTLVLPEKVNNSISRELVYTGITRAKKMVHVCACEHVFKKALDRLTERDSGLKDKLKIH